MWVGSTRDPRKDQHVHVHVWFVLCHVWRVRSRSSNLNLLLSVISFMELARVVKLPLSSFLVREKQIQHPNTPLIHTRKSLRHQNLNSSPNYSITPKTHFKSQLNDETTRSNSEICGAKFNQKTPSEKTNNLESYAPTMSEIVESSRLQNLDLQLQRFGPFFRITAKSLESGSELGRAEGVIRFWFGGKILHLDSMKLQRETIGMSKSIFGIGLFLGAVAIRLGYDCGCVKAELLAINDTHLYHSKLVRFYKRLGFKEVYEVKGGSVRDLSDMLVWGGVGTRMDANLQHLMLKWCSRFKPTAPT
ncbi:uncharacterized protein LOC131000818 [Salvia miltiorrhiza]|uniref:uncharacterized protein LOC131000818 n=1 Tax=Salvia miltiorrhiza TaxID=226208 RepID=UPI0025ABA72A|nr:uncharacterized protein LOC131000818 [Salvia miltiorrhiza]